MSFEVKLPPEEMEKLRHTPRPKSTLRYSRRAVTGILLVTLSAAVILRSFVFKAGYNTTLMAEVGIVRAPVSGVVRALNADVGARIRREQVVGIFGVNVGLLSAVAAASEDTRKIEAQLRTVDERLRSLGVDQRRIEREASLYRVQKTAQLTAQRDAAAADVARSDAQQALARANRDRAETLAASGFLSASGIDKAQESYDAASAAVLSARANLRRSVVEMRAAASGFLLTSGYSDVQYSTQRLADIKMIRDELQAQRERLRVSLQTAREFTRGIWAEPGHTLQIPLRATVNGRVWAKLAASGEAVHEGNPIYLVADCSRFYAYFTVGRGTYSGLKIGAPVKFVTFSGSQKWDGQIVNLGMGDTSQLRLTGSVPTPGADRYLIGARINLPPKDQQTCPAGIAGRIVI